MSEKKNLGTLGLENFKEAVKLKPKTQGSVGLRPTTSGTAGKSSGNPPASGNTARNQGKS